MGSSAFKVGSSATASNAAKEVALTRQQWAGRATGPDALTDQMRARLKEGH
jgi:hypothetical protein